MSFSIHLNVKYIMLSKYTLFDSSSVVSLRVDIIAKVPLSSSSRPEKTGKNRFSIPSSGALYFDFSFISIHFTNSSSLIAVNGICDIIMNEIDGELDLSGPKKNLPNVEIPTSKNTVFRGAINPNAETQKKPEEKKVSQASNRALTQSLPGQQKPEEFGEAFTISRNIVFRAESVSEAFPNQSLNQSPKKLQNEDNSKPKALNGKKLEDLIRTFLKHSVVSGLKQNLALFDAVNERQDPSLKANFCCQACGKLKFSLVLECSHSVCANCFVESVKKLMGNISFENFIACYCPQCGFLPSALFLNKVLPQFPIKVSLDRYCSWCKRTMNLFEDFPQELKCSHLCTQCYFGEVFLKVKSCLCCDQPFNNISYTKERTLKCMSCKRKGLVISGGYRTIHSNHCFCFSCLVKIAEQQCVCLYCNQEVTGTQKTIFQQFLNKRCPCCNSIKCINEIEICNYCNKMVCLDCAQTRMCECSIKLN